MKKIKVWRIEDTYGIGPYRASNSTEARKLLAWVERPRIYAYSGEKSFNVRRFDSMCKKGWKFAWLSEDLAVNHCNGNLEKLKELGFTLKTKVVGRYRIFSDNQVMYFERSDK